MSAHEISSEARAQLERWPAKARTLFEELVEDAASDLQRELLERVLLAGHSSGEVHAFADEIRGMSDDEVYDACTLHDAAPEDYTVAQLLRAEADPLFAFELKGGVIDPAETSDAPGAAATPPAPKVRELEGAPDDALAAALAKKKKAFEAESSEARPRPMDWNALGGSAPVPTTGGGTPALGGTAKKLMEDLLAEATRALGVAWREVEIDGGGMPLADALTTAASALSRGLPVPCAIGPNPGDHRRLVVLLQLSTSGKNRAYQLYDPLTQELVWANEGDLLMGRELPFNNKVNRRVTRMALPQSMRAAF